MLKEIYAENFALIDKLRQGFDAGLTVLTGETGAGKSVIVDAVGLLMGGRFEQQFIRSGSDKCIVEGVFAPPFPAAAIELLQNAGLDIDAEEDIILSREGSRTGKNTARINFRPVTLALLRDLGRILINIHGQAEYTTLCEEEKQLEMTDAFGGESLLKQKKAVAEAWDKFCSLETEYQQLQKTIKEAAQKEDFLRFQIKELKNANLLPDEDEELRQTAQKLAHGEKLLACSMESKELLNGSGSILEQLDTVLYDLKQIAAKDSSAKEMSERAESIYFELEDLAANVADYAESINFDPNYIEEVQSRLAELERLKKKYRMSIAEMLEYKQKCEQELASIDHADEMLQQKEKEKSASFADYEAKAAVLTGLRAAAAKALSQKISIELHELYMPEASFEARLIPCPPSAEGPEKICFMLAANPGEPFAELAKTASGGELSRVILAIKVITADADKVPTLVFDEIDTGLGGGAVSAVAKRLSAVAKGAQVFCVTHAPILAAKADEHIHIFKRTEGGRTVIRTETLDTDARVQELCRMLAGENITEQTVAQAKEMLR
ncbi:MAG: DNA repair protein RecN [Firmicutes bacterium]|nr:DNA repair protein RecN [Bacillota bacterium]